jgi:hypothetical protein
VGKGFKEKAKDLFAHLLSYVDSSEDADRVFSYYTRQQVQFLDYRLGVMFLTIQISMLAFVVGYVIIYKQGYLKFEESKGLTVLHVTGDAVATSSGAPGQRYFSNEELTYPGLENGNVFISTRLSVSRQMRGMCEDMQMPCVSDGDCTVGGQGKCTELGFCREHSWCNQDPKPQIYSMETDRLQIWARSAIQYVRLAPEKVFSSDSERDGPHPGNTFNIRQLLLMAKPLPVNYEEVAELGAVFDVTFRYDCNVKKDSCKPEMWVRRLDTMLDPDNIGFGFNHAEYVDGNTRYLNEVRGLRFVFRTTGRGKKRSVSALIMVGSTSGALLGFAAVIADLFLTKIMSNRKKYIARKFDYSPDFSSIFEKQQEEVPQRVTREDADRIEEEIINKERKWMAKFEEEDV